LAFVAALFAADRGWPDFSEISNMISRKYGLSGNSGLLFCCYERGPNHLIRWNRIDE
jgi:hypothetical protein